MKRVPPMRWCQDPACGHNWRGWSSSCPKCAARPPEDGESLRDYRRRVLDPQRNRREGVAENSESDSGLTAVSSDRVPGSRSLPPVAVAVEGGEALRDYRRRVLDPERNAR